MRGQQGILISIYETKLYISQVNKTKSSFDTYDFKNRIKPHLFWELYMLYHSPKTFSNHVPYFQSLVNILFCIDIFSPIITIQDTFCNNLYKNNKYCQRWPIYYTLYAGSYNAFTYLLKEKIAS